MGKSLVKLKPSYRGPGMEGAALLDKPEVGPIVSLRPPPQGALGAALLLGYMPPITGQPEGTC